MWGAPLLLLSSAAFGIVQAAAPPRPRGVSPEHAKYYKDPKTFTCITAPSTTLPFSRVNDDYCDCPDGSDEPGTAACSYLAYNMHIVPKSDQNATLTLPGFYCKNKGHIPNYIPFTHVNDGVCDYEWCCDGGDEYGGVGGVKCPDRCAEIGKEWRKKEEQRAKELAAANKRRKELVEKAGVLTREVERKVEELTRDVAMKEGEVKLLEQQLREVERREKGKIVKNVGQGGKLGVLVGLAKDRVEELRNKLIQVKSAREGVVERVIELENILADLKTEHNPNFNDDGVKRAVRAWEDYAARDTAEQDKLHEDVEKDLDELIKPDTETGVIKWEEYEAEPEEDTDLLYQFEAYLPPTLRRWVDVKIRDLRVFLVENGVLAFPTPSGSEPTAVTKARNDLTSAENAMSNLKRDLDSNREDLTKDYGPDAIFRALKGTCITKDVGEYTYSFCFLEKTQQKQKRGGGDTNMGNYSGLEKVFVDEEVGPDGKGLGKGERYVMKFENGQHCWNGPNRSTRVFLTCSHEEEIWKVSEEEKCVYRMDVGTASVCGPEARASRREKDEL